MTRLEADQSPRPYQEYRYLGGRLDEGFFHQAQEFLANGQNLGLREARVYCRSSRNYAQGVGLRLEPEQERLYAYLRTMMPPDSSTNGQKDCPWFLCDRELLAQVLLLTEDQETYEQFTQFLPNIFSKSS